MYNSNVFARAHSAGIFRPDRIPTLSKLPRELGRETRPCERCGEETEHILYQVPKKMVIVYVRNHANNLHATCVSCARSTVLTGEERERVLESLG
ncbi:MAG: hypothetical protein ACRDTR_13905 [Rubrobacter sp.]